MTQRRAIILLLIGITIGAAFGHPSLHALITLRSEKGAPLTHNELDANFSALFRAPAAVSVASGTVTVNGTGTYIIDGPSSINTVTQVLGTVNGDQVTFTAANASRQIVFSAGSSLILAQGLDFTLNSVNDVLILRGKGGNIMREETRNSLP